MWTDFLEQINDLMLEEKAARQVSDHNKLAEICTRIVSNFGLKKGFGVSYERKRLGRVGVFGHLSLIFLFLFEQVPYFMN